MINDRAIKYSEAIKEGTRDAMRASSQVFVYGIGAPGKSGIFGTTSGLAEEFGGRRVLDTPISEQALTFLAIGAANAGLRPILVHQRLDFLILTMDQLANWAGPWRFISGGKCVLPMTIRAIVGKGWGQGPQHSKSLHSWFAHIPGLQVVTPATPYDAKGLLIASIMSNDPTVFIESRSLFDMTESVPPEPYMLRIGEAIVRRSGHDITIVAFGSTMPMAMAAADELSGEGVSAEVIDLRSLAPLDYATVTSSLKKTGRLLVIEGDWSAFGVAAEVITGTLERLTTPLRSSPVRIAWPDTYVPTSAPLENAFYPNVETMKATIRKVVGAPAVGQP